MGTHSLFLSYRDSAGPSVYTYVSGEPIILGSSFGSSFVPSVSPANHSSRNRVVHFLGEVYAVLHDGVYRYNQGPGNFPSGSGPGTWSKSALDGGLTFSDPLLLNADQQYLSGLYVVIIGGQPRIFGIKRHTLSDTSWETFSFDGSSWTESGPISTSLTPTAADTSGGGIHNMFVYRNLLFFSYGGVGGSAVHALLDPSTDAFSLVTSVGAETFSTTSYLVEYCVYLDRLFAINAASTSNAACLWEYSAGNWNYVTTLAPAGSLTAVNQQEARNCLFTDGTNLYAFVLTQSPAQAWQCYQLDNTLTVADISSSVLPGTLLSGRIATERMQVVIDNDTNIGIPAFLLYHSLDGASGTLRSAYTWNGNASLITQIGLGGSASHAAPTDTRAGGERFFVDGQLDAYILSRTSVLGGEQITFSVVGDSAGASDKKFKLYYTAEGEPDVLEATLKGPVTGGAATLNGTLNQVEGVAADGTQYTVVWDTFADGLVAGQFVTRYPKTFI